ncbi:rRNA-binding ribosome biosynthesis protein RPF2 KNAG_0L01950 [Huiozyma naganishii CBS 8797]|uniref:Ribosome production factor 2 homolog n=1 Tax=Huiozyma naganishii (strain ATCC MYA-139 / BCRC 22969 / CBS 8797 / KCTC 17520 / NBRC 10181 / NCYC 3082 / Yp74L-3) TaxID=1071383 RepID=J7SAK0_HUIN7|nr:hypothetical protein KNAG_0L01950 [Kazachstania naganishii CBS 8797]CCK72814.1 hypothetical protein KNAG_0L01950 [Kazachstania naganishii CBS 8797]
MIRTVKPKNARAKRALEKREPKLVENVKRALFVPGESSSQYLHDVCVELGNLKKPYVKRFQRKNKVRCFEDASSLEFLAEKNDSSLVVVATHSKKRPHTLTFARTFNYKVYDMVELSVLRESSRLMSELRGESAAAGIAAAQVGLNPMFSFQGALFDTHPVYRQLKSLFMDFFRGDRAHDEQHNLQDVAGLQHVISLTVGEPETEETTPPLLFRVYRLRTYRSEGQKLPRVELVETGPRLDFKVGRVHTPEPDLVREAHVRAKQTLGAPQVKNVERDSMGDKFGRVHLGKQELMKLQTRKMKGLKSKFDQTPGEDDPEISDDSYGEDFTTATDIDVAPPAKKKQRK